MLGSRLAWLLLTDPSVDNDIICFSPSGRHLKSRQHGTLARVLFIIALYELLTTITVVLLTPLGPNSNCDH